MPTPNAPHGPLDQAMLADFEAHFDGMNADIAATVSRVHTTSPVPPSEDSRHFWRVDASWSIDSDLDFSPDWIELDASVSDELVNWEKTPPWRYALFSLGEQVDVFDNPSLPFHVNDKGKVLFSSGVWKGGAYQDIIVENPGEIGYCQTLGMNDDGEIVGVGFPQREPENGFHYPQGGGGSTITFPLTVAWWADEDAAPVPVENDDFFAEPVWLEGASGSFPYDMLISDDGRFVAKRPAPPGTSDFLGTWDRDGNGFSENLIANPPADFQPMFTGEPDLVWGPMAEGTLLVRGAGQISFDGTYNRFIRTPGPAGALGAFPPVGPPMFDAGGGINVPGIVPTENSLEDYLTDVYDRQVNLEVEVRLEPTIIPVDWDDDDNGGMEAGLNSPPFTRSGEQLAILSEVNAFRAENPYPDSGWVPHVKVFLLGCTDFIGAKGPTPGDALGLTRQGPPGECWIVADGLDDDVSAFTLPRTIAHEIGHVILGGGHPDVGTGPAPLEGSDQSRRLMVSGPKKGPFPGVLLVKKEWDKAEGWMRTNIESTGQ